MLGMTAITPATPNRTIFCPRKSDGVSILFGRDVKRNHHSQNARPTRYQVVFERAHKSVRQTLRIAVGVREVTLGGYPTGGVADGKAVPSAISGEEKPATHSLSIGRPGAQHEHIPPKG